MRLAPLINSVKIASKPDTDHTTGIGQVAITGKYDSRKDSFGLEAAYALDSANTLHGVYGVTDEKVLSLGWETGFVAFGRRNTVDLNYYPHTDVTALKVAVRQSKTKVSGVFTFNNFTSSHIKDHAENYELDAKLNGMESLKMNFNAKTNAAKVKISRKLDAKNTLQAEYVYANRDHRYVSVCFKHAYSKTHTFAVTTNYGTKKYDVEWDCKTDNGPWTISTAFPFNAR